MEKAVVGGDSSSVKDIAWSSVGEVHAQYGTVGISLFQPSSVAKQNTGLSKGGPIGLVTWGE